MSFDAVRLWPPPLGRCPRHGRPRPAGAAPPRRFDGNDPHGDVIGVPRTVETLGSKAGDRQRDQLGVGPQASGRSRASSDSPRDALRWISPDDRPVKAGSPVSNAQRRPGQNAAPLVEKIDLSSSLLRSHVRRRAHHTAGLRAVGVCSEGLAGCDHGVSVLGLPAPASSIAPPWGSTLANPQSITWTSPNEPTMIFDGFKSR